ncbi:dihydrolipoyl dehydrogenase [Chromatiales bacterium (ex Bugula neritina AB1)]|nr:dihydrolipoyl dehydrogenase [Chromatiales bacterium (ex Bugula neritina AB1)]
MADRKCRLLVLGAGPGGYVCAIKAGQLGLDTVIIEAEKPGGTCLNVGCIPSKALIHAADEFYKTRAFSRDNELGISVSAAVMDLEKTVQWKNGIVDRLNRGVTGLLKKASVELISGTAKFLDGKTVEVISAEGRQAIQAENIVIATGSVPVALPLLPFGDRVWSSADLLACTELPESIAIVGGGYIGLELGCAVAKLGAGVSIIEASERILPQYDEALTAPVVKRLAQLGVNIMTKTRAEGIGPSGLELVADDGSNLALNADKVLVTVGRKPQMEGWGLEELQLTLEGQGLQINEKCQTSMRGVYAIGDVTGEPMLAHRAMAQGEMVAGIIAGENLVWDKNSIPAVCFTDPEIVTVGLAPLEAVEQDIAIDVSEFPFQASGRAMTMQRTDGFIRLITCKQDGVVLGIQAVGTGVSELSAAFSLAIEMAACAEDIAATVHAHPTMSEGFQEAAMHAVGRAIHL